MIEKLSKQTESYSQVIENYPDFIEIKDAWNASLVGRGLESLWMRHEWIDAWWQAFGTSQRMFIPTVIRDNRVMALAPLMIQKTKLKFVSAQALGFIETGITPRWDIIGPEIGPADIKELWQLLEQEARQWDLAILENLATDSPGYHVLKSFMQDEGIGFVEEPARMSPYIDLEPGNGGYLRGATKNLRRNINRAKNRLAQEGNYHAIEVTEPEEFSKYLNVCFDISKRSWKGPLGKDLGEAPWRRKFFEVFSETAIREGWVSIWLLKLNDDYIAFEYLLRHGSEALPLAGDFDSAYKWYSPGVLLRSLLLDKLVTQGVRRYEFGGTIYPYKLQWTKNTKPHVRFWVFNRRFTSKCLYLIKAHILSRLGRGNNRPS